MINIAKPIISKEEIKAVTDVLKSGMLVQGEKVKEFEEKFASYIGVKHAVAVNSGTAALHTALLAIGIKKGDEIITTPFSFIASSNAILMCGAKPVYVDINPKTFNIDTSLIENAITEKTKAILPVHLYGQPCNMGKLRSLCNEHNLALIEDSCQAHGAEYAGKKAGSFGNAGCFSFYATKNMTCGEGGMVTTNDAFVAERAREIRQHGGKFRYNPHRLGYNYRMTNISAAIGLEQLKKLDEWNRMRRENAKFMTELLSDIEGITTPHVESDRRHIYHQYTIRNSNRDKLLSKLIGKGINAKVFYPTPLNKMQHIIDAVGEVSCPEAELASNEVISLPIHPSVSKKDLANIADVIARHFY